MLRRWLTIMGLLIFCVIIILPPIIHGYVYPTLGDDTAVHLKVLDLIKSGEPVSFRFVGYIIVGYPLVWISNLTGLSVDTLFLWFNYISLALAGVIIYLVMSRLVNMVTGWMALLLTLFCAQGILFLFYYGMIFNVINMGIILPLLFYSIVKYLTGKKTYYFVLVVFLSCLFGAFHTSGIYLPFIAGLSVLTYVVYSLIKKQKVRIDIVVMGGGLAIAGTLAFVIFVPGLAIISGDIVHSFGYAVGVPMLDYLLGIVSLSVLVLVAFAGVFGREILKNMNAGIRNLVTPLACTVVLLAISAFIKLSVDPWRQALDLATVLALLVAVFVGSWAQKNRIAMAVIVFVVGFGLYHNLPTWFSYNSAVLPVDMKAIAYVNTLDYKTYNCSDKIAPWIYDRFTKPQYIDGNSDLILVRNVPMTPRSDETNMWYEKFGVVPDSTYGLVKTFSDGKVEVKVYEKECYVK